MKITNYIYLLSFAIIVIIGCDSKTDSNFEEDRNENNVVSRFLSNVKSLESDTNKNPIVAFKELAEEIAEDKIVLSKKNIKKILIMSKEYSNCVIVTGNHTIVKIISFDNCQQSGSWKACMPSVEGYIKKGKLNYKKDYMNNVIGTSDKQERVAYFFSIDEKKSEQIADSLKEPQSTYNEDNEKNIIFEEETGPKSPNYYICYSENDNKNLQLWIGFDEKEKASKVKYKGMNLDMDLVFVKERNENEGGPYPVLVEYYNEIYEEEVNGMYKLTKSGNWYYAEYTRGSDSKKFNFIIDHKANNFSKNPCF